MPTKRPIRTLLAYHEAGHAVAAVLLGVQVEQVTIVPTAEALGRVCHAPEADPAKLNAISVAGDVAVSIYRPGGKHLLERHAGQFNRPAGPCRPFLNDAECLAAVAVTSEPRLLARFLASGATRVGDMGLRSWEVTALAYPAISTAWDLLERHWRAVHVLAGELLILGTVDGARVAEIVATATRPTRATPTPRTTTTPTTTPRHTATTRCNGYSRKGPRTAGKRRPVSGSFSSARL